MAWIHAQRLPGTGSGGGGGSTQAWNRVTQDVITAWTAGGLSINMPVVGAGIINQSVNVNYQEKLLLFGSDYTIVGNNVVIQFADDPSFVGGTATFQINYAYTV